MIRRLGSMDGLACKGKERHAASRCQNIGIQLGEFHLKRGFVIRSYTKQ
jgi:hypothetical protein